jgi:hypothetical protein
VPSPDEAVANYIRAKDGNRPHLLERAFVENAALHIHVQTDAIVFPQYVGGREAIAETLVRRFNQNYENIYTFCLAAPPRAADRTFACGWLVAMSEKQGGAVRVGTGRYEWSFASEGSLAESLEITIFAMEILPAEQLDKVMSWVAALPYPWCPLDRAAHEAPEIPGVERVLRYQRSSGA